jgi:hypothetical protein
VISEALYYYTLFGDFRLLFDFSQVYLKITKKLDPPCLQGTLTMP